MRPELIAETHPETALENIIKGDCWRISVLTEGLLRLEYDPDGIFEDRATQSVWNRNFPKSTFRVIDGDDSLEIITPKAHLIYDRKPFSANGLSIQAIGNYSAYHSIWHYGEDFKDLGGTARTLDEADGAISLDHGIVSRDVWLSGKTDGLSPGAKDASTSISGLTGMTICRRSETLPACAERVPWFRATHSETGGAVTINIQKKLIRN